MILITMLSACCMHLSVDTYWAGCCVEVPSKSGFIAVAPIQLVEFPIDHVGNGFGLAIIIDLIFW